MAKLSATQVLEIRRKWSEATIKSVERLGSEYNVSVSTIDAIVKGRTWKECGEASVEGPGGSPAVAE